VEQSVDESPEPPIILQEHAEEFYENVDVAEPLAGESEIPEHTVETPVGEPVKGMVEGKTTEETIENPVVEDVPVAESVAKESVSEEPVMQEETVEERIVQALPVVIPLAVISEKPIEHITAEPSIEISAETPPRPETPVVVNEEDETTEHPLIETTPVTESLDSQPVKAGVSDADPLPESQIEHETFESEHVEHTMEHEIVEDKGLDEETAEAPEATDQTKPIEEQVVEEASPVDARRVEEVTTVKEGAKSTDLTLTKDSSKEQKSDDFNQDKDEQAISKEVHPAITLPTIDPS
jgi:hypothetical protein